MDAAAATPPRAWMPGGAAGPPRARRRSEPQATAGAAWMPPAGRGTGAAAAPLAPHGKHCRAAWMAERPMKGYARRGTHYALRYAAARSIDGSSGGGAAAGLSLGAEFSTKRPRRRTGFLRVRVFRGRVLRLRSSR